MVLARLPYRVEGVALDAHIADSTGASQTFATGAVVPRGAVLHAQVRVTGISDTPVRHVIHAEVRRPNGQPLPALTQNLFTSDGCAQIVVPVAHNEQPGMWTIVATEVVSGLHAGLSYQVQ